MSWRERVKIGAVKRNAGARLEVAIERTREAAAVTISTVAADWLHGSARDRELARGHVRLRLEKLDELVELLEKADREARRRGWREGA